MNDKLTTVLKWLAIGSFAIIIVLVLGDYYIQIYQPTLALNEFRDQTSYLDYLLASQERSEIFLESQQNFVRYHNMFMDDRSLWNDEEFVSDIEDVLDTVVLSGKSLNSISPVPEEFEKYHSYMTQIWYETDDLRDDYTAGLRNQDMSKIEDAMAHIEIITAYFELATLELSQ